MDRLGVVIAVLDEGYCEHEQNSSNWLLSRVVLGGAAAWGLRAPPEVASKPDSVNNATTA
jgi:hypothetical protein